MAARYAVFFVVAGLVMGSAHYYVWARLVRDAGLPAPWARIVTVVIAILFLLVMSGFVIARALPRAVSSPVMWTTYTWLGLLFFLVFSLGLSDAARAVAMRFGDGPVPADPDRRLAISRMF